MEVFNKPFPMTSPFYLFLYFIVLVYRFIAFLHAVNTYLPPKKPIVRRSIKYFLCRTHKAIESYYLKILIILHPPNRGQRSLYKGQSCTRKFVSAKY